MDIEDPLAGNQDDLEYDQEDEGVQVTNPERQNQITSSTAQALKQSTQTQQLAKSQTQQQVDEEEEDDQQQEVDYTPSYFSQRKIGSLT